MTTAGPYVVTANVEIHLITIDMKLAKSKNAPQILFEKDLPQLPTVEKVGPHFDGAAITTMFLTAAILTFISWVVLTRLFGEDSME